MVSIIKNEFRLMNVGKKTKRVASSKLKVKIDYNKKNWNSIMNMVYDSRKMSNRYLVIYEELSASSEIVLEPSLDDKD